MDPTEWLDHIWVPSATLWLTEMAVSSQFDDQSRIPDDSPEQVGASQLRSQGLPAHTAINAPHNLDEHIYHMWMFNGKEFNRVASGIHGSRKKSYQTWTHKQNSPGDPVGHWQVKVPTEAGQMIGTLRFDVTW